MGGGVTSVDHNRTIWADGNVLYYDIGGHLTNK